MTGHAKDTYAFLDFALTPCQRRLLKGCDSVTIGARAFDLLAMFASRPGEVLSAATLMRAAWPDTVVEEANLRVQIGVLRRLLGDAGQKPPIATVPGRGYCFTAPVKRLRPMPRLNGRDEVGKGRPDHAERPVLYRDDTTLAPGGRALALLLVLARRAGEVLSHRELESAVWSGAVDASNVRAQVCSLRKALGDGADGQRFIVNVMGRGYSFVGDIDLLPSA